MTPSHNTVMMTMLHKWSLKMGKVKELRFIIPTLKNGYKKDPSTSNITWVKSLYSIRHLYKVRSCSLRDQWLRSWFSSVSSQRERTFPYSNINLRSSSFLLRLPMLAITLRLTPTSQILTFHPSQVTNRAAPLIWSSMWKDKRRRSLWLKCQKSSLRILISCHRKNSH